MKGSEYRLNKKKMHNERFDHVKSLKCIRSVRLYPEIPSFVKSFISLLSLISLTRITAQCKARESQLFCISSGFITQCKFLDQDRTRKCMNKI